MLYKKRSLLDNKGMKRRERGIRIALAALMLLFIWGHSMMPASVSGRESEWVRELLEPLLALLQRGFFHLGLELEPSTLVRKLAHFTEFMVLGFLVGLMLERPEGKTRFFPAEGICLAAACMDEFIQRFVPGRGPGLKDVLIDFSGATVGVCLAMAAICLVWLINNRKKSDPPEG